MDFSQKWQRLFWSLLPPQTCMDGVVSIGTNHTSVTKNVPIKKLVIVKGQHFFLFVWGHV